MIGQFIFKTSRNLVGKGNDTCTGTIESTWQVYEAVYKSKDEAFHAQHSSHMFEFSWIKEIGRRDRFVDLYK